MKSMALLFAVLLLVSCAPPSNGTSRYAPATGYSYACFMGYTAPELDCSRHNDPRTCVAAGGRATCPSYFVLMHPQVNDEPRPLCGRLVVEPDDRDFYILPTCDCEASRQFYPEDQYVTFSSRRFRIGHGLTWADLWRSADERLVP
jgi:hypothetical protein